jgi:bifunctional lysine-specific demethylase and histidyl-hydroxylase NO66
VTKDHGAVDPAAGRPATETDGPGHPALRRVSARDTGVFAAEHWGMRPLLSRGAQLPEGFGDLFGAAAVDDLTSSRGLRSPFVRMAEDGEVIAADRYTRGGGAGAGVPDQVADDRVLALMGDGATLVLQALHRTWPPLVRFGSQLSTELGHPVQINAYVTPRQSQGFAPHYDVHDVFVLQIAGRKHWRIHEPVFTDPLPDHNWEKRRDAVRERAAQAPVIDAILEPGDALYLPRGYLHSASALGETSIHLTVGVHPITRQQLVRQILTSAQDVAALRESLPMGTDLADPAVLAPILTETLADLRRHLDATRPEDVAAAIGADLVDRTRPGPLGPLASLVAAERLDGSTRLRLRTGLRGRVTRGETSLRLRLIDKAVTLPIAAEAALKAVLAGEPLTPLDLPGLDAAEQLVVARRLLREGVLVPAG